MSMYFNYLLYQQTNRYIGPIVGYGDSELLAGSYLYIFQTHQFTDLEILIETSCSVNAESSVHESDSILDLALRYGEHHELRSEEQSYELSEIGKYLEKRQGFEVFPCHEFTQVEKSFLYFFPRRIVKLKKLLPPNLGQLEQ